LSTGISGKYADTWVLIVIRPVRRDIGILWVQYKSLATAAVLLAPLIGPLPG
jgi:hypothetical protein